MGERPRVEGRVRAGPRSGRAVAGPGLHPAVSARDARRDPGGSASGPRRHAWARRLPAAGWATRSAEAGAAWGRAGLKMLRACGLGAPAAWSGRGAPVRAPGVPRLGL